MPNRLTIRPGMPLAAAIATFAVACTWVSLTPEGEGVQILRAGEVSDCEKLGKASSKTAERVLLFARTERKMREELEALARNEAAEMGGDAIVPLGAPAGGRQSFDVYRCQTF
ncbi:MAG TPA: DUF4156 domain-containing protein [Myxococcota bacterium]|nr:DUF4156 domain-containing protein [Myxococcota bacterium]